MPNPIKYGRAKQSMNQDDLAERMNVTRTTISNWETAKAIPKVSQIIALARILDIPIDDLMHHFTDHEYNNKEE